MDRKAIGIELNPDYAALARGRMDVETRQARIFGGIR
jgi:DNA modification methylase